MHLLQLMNIFNRNKSDAPGSCNITEQTIDSPRGSQNPINPAGNVYDPVNTSPKGMDAPDASNDQRWSSMKNGGYYK